MTGNSLVVYDKDAQQEICKLLGISGSANHITLLFKLAEHYQLDPLTKEIALIPNKGPFIGVWGRIHIAHRSGRLDGLELDDEWETDRHYCVRCVVWRNDMGHPAAKVVGRVGKHEKKEWPMEIARARALRAGLGFAFSIHDSYDDQDNDEWAPPPDERVQATVVDMATGEVRQDAPAAPKKRGRVNRPEPDSAREADAEADRTATSPSRAAVTTSKGPDPAPSEPATIVVGGHTLAQRLAMAARDAGIDDDQTRHEVIQAATGGTYTRGTDIPEDIDPATHDRLFAAFAGLADGTVELRYDENGRARLVRPRKL